MTTTEYDVVVVGASIAGCAAATFLARAGASVALIERSPDPAAFKRVCTHFIQSSGVPTLERLGVLEALEAAGAVRTGGEMWTRWGWARSSAESRWGHSLNIRREKLDPVLRRLAAETDGVTLRAGRTVDELLREDGRVRGVCVVGRDGARAEVRAPLTVGADGRDSRVAAMAGLKRSSKPHGRFAYWAYYEDVPLASGQRAQLWMGDPDMAYAFPTDDGLTMLTAFPTKAHLTEFKDDPEGAFDRYIRALPDAPPIDGGRRVSRLIGKLDMPSVSHRSSGPGIALVGDAAIASDPLWGVGCGWALQSAEWLADAAAQALVTGRGLDRALARYRRHHRFALFGYELMNRDLSTGRRLNHLERLLFSAAARDPRFAAHVEGFSTRNMPVHEFIGPRALVRAGWINARHRRAARKPPAGRPRQEVAA